MGSQGLGSNFYWFWHDPLGRCVKRWLGNGNGVPTGPITYFYYDGWNLVQEGPNASTADRLYVHGGRVDEIVASKQGGQWYNHQYHARGHCLLLTNSSGAIQEQYDYDAFGMPYIYNAAGTSLGNSGGVGNRFLFTGREWLKDLRVYDYRNRVYQPELGRFLQPDPKQFEAGDYNLYRYCHNDPVNKSDPSGLNALFMVGGNRENPNYFTKIAETWAKKYEASHKGETASVVQVRTKADMANALKTNQNLDRVDYVRHSSSANLYLSDDGAGFISKRDIASLPTNNVERGASIMLSGCETAKGPGSIAEAFANRFGQTVIGTKTGLSFGLPGLNKLTDALNSIPRSKGTVAGNPYTFVEPSK